MVAVVKVWISLILDEWQWPDYEGRGGGNFEPLTKRNRMSANELKLVWIARIACVTLEIYIYKIIRICSYV
jgi:hypothetical protein